MALVTELELPQLDYLAEDLKGERFHDARMPGVELDGEPCSDRDTGSTDWRGCR